MVVKVSHPAQKMKRVAQPGDWARASTEHIEQIAKSAIQILRPRLSVFIAHSPCSRMTRPAYCGTGRKESCRTAAIKVAARSSRGADPQGIAAALRRGRAGRSIGLRGEAKRCPAIPIQIDPHPHGPPL